MRILSGVVVAVVTLAATASPVGDPYVISVVTQHQGRLLGADDRPVTGVKHMRFGVYDAPEAGQLVWSCEADVDLEDGLYEVWLGGGVRSPWYFDCTGESVIASRLGERRWLEVKVEETTLTPRSLMDTRDFGPPPDEHTYPRPKYEIGDFAVYAEPPSH